MSVETRPDLSISLVNWNTCDLIRGCIQAIRRSVVAIEVEIIVVDNHSTDGSVEMLRREFPEIHLIANDDNLGFTKANNQALAVSRGRHFMLLNSDTEALPGALDRMVAYLDSHPDVGAVSARTWLDHAKTIELAALPPFDPLNVFLATSDALRRFTRLAKFHRETRRIARGKEDVTVQGIVGACFMVPRAVIEKIGPLDEEMFMYFEDADWSRKIHKLGLRLVVVHDAEIIHFHDKSGANNPRKHQILEESMTTHFRKTYGLPVLLAFGAGMKIKPPFDRVYRALKRRLLPDAPPRQIPISQPYLEWPAFSGALEYRFEIGLDPVFAAHGGCYLQTNRIDLTALATAETIGQHYYWRVFARTADNRWVRGPSGAFIPVDAAE